MRMKLVNKRKFIARVTEIIIFIGTLITTPIAINCANAMRGYAAQGGEYLLPIMGLLFMFVVETVYEEGEKNG